MKDREKVIKGLELCEIGSSDKCYETSCPYYLNGCTEELKADALELLKEQSEIVRCEDCKHRPTYPKACGAEINGRWCYWCELLMAWKPDDWFCANGKRR